MTAMTIGSLTAPQQKPDVAALAPARAEQTAEPTPEQKKAAREFEAIFIRQLLSSLEKSTGLSGGESSGGAVFRSMMVGALADTAAEGGGIGMSELILKAMMPQAPPAKLDLSHQEPTFQMGTWHSGEHSRGHSAVAPIGSARLGVASRVLTEARSAPMLSERDSTLTAPPLSEGNVR
jgi:Rod binding domain-containing protein